MCFVIIIGASRLVFIVSVIDVSASKEFKLRLKIEELEIKISIFLFVCFSIFLTHFGF